MLINITMFSTELIQFINKRLHTLPSLSKKEREVMRLLVEKCVLLNVKHP